VAVACFAWIGRNLRNSARIGLPLLAFVALPFASAGSQELVPAAHTPAPVGLNVLLASGAYNSGDIAFDPSLPVSDASARISGWSVAYGRTFGLLGRSANLAAILPYVAGDLEGVYLSEQTYVDRSGLGDAVVRLGVNLLGAPAMDLETFAGYRPGALLGAILTVKAPTGEYFPSKLINIGTNRWAFKTEIALVNVAGPWAFDLYLGTWFFTDNANFYGGSRREQDPILSTEAHVRRTLRPGLWVAADANFWRGGRTSIDGVAKDDLQQNSRVGLTLAWQVARGHGLRLATSRGAFTRIGGDFTSVGLSYTFSWGLK
jgi:hypothetical protein